MTAAQFVLNFKIRCISFRTFVFFFNIEVFDDIEVTFIIFALYEEHEISKKHQRNEIIRRHWVHSLNLIRTDNGQFQVTFMRSYPEE